MNKTVLGMMIVAVCLSSEVALAQATVPVGTFPIKLRRQVPALPSADVFFAQRIGPGGISGTRSGCGFSE